MNFTRQKLIYIGLRRFSQKTLPNYRAFMVFSSMIIVMAKLRGNGKQIFRRSSLQGFSLRTPPFLDPEKP